MPGTSYTSTPGQQGHVKPPALLVLVARYRHLSADSVARLQSAASDLSQELLEGSTAASGCVVLSTCNRFEIYCEIAPASEVGDARSDVLEAVSYCSGLPLPDVLALFEYRIGPAVVEHLFAVACGLDSLVIGEREIAGQIRRALVQAQSAGAATGQLVRLFQGALRTAKDVGSQTLLGSAGRSVASVAVEQAAATLNLAGLSGLSVVVIGSGSYAACILDLLSKEGCSAVTVFSRSGRASAFTATHAVTAVPEAELEQAIDRADVVIGCSGRGSRIGRSLMAGLQNGTRRLVAVDLAPNLDFDPDVADLPGVDLITLESLSEVAPQADAAQLQLARTIIRQATCRFWERESLRAIDVAIVALRQHLHEVLVREIEDVRKRNGTSSSVEDTSRALRRLVRQLLHTPAVRAREMAAAGRHHEYAAALETLFGISVDIGDPSGLAAGQVQKVRRPVPHINEMPLGASHRGKQVPLAGVA